MYFMFNVIGLILFSMNRNAESKVLKGYTQIIQTH